MSLPSLPPLSAGASTYDKSECDYDGKSFSIAPLNSRTASFDNASTNESTLVYVDSNADSLPYVVDITQLPSSLAGDMA